MNGSYNAGWNVYSITNLNDKRKSQYVWLYVKLVGGFKIKLVHAASNRETVLESRYCGTFESFKKIWQSYCRNAAIKPQYVASIEPEDKP